MTAGEDDHATDGPDGAPRTRTLVIALVSTVVTVAVFTVALQFTPRGTENTSAAGDEPSRTDSSSRPATTAQTVPSRTGVDPGSTGAAPTTPSAPTTAPVRSGPRFEEWVNEVAAWLDIPRRTMHAYAAATVTLADEKPECGLSWVTLAGVGRTASDHGRARGGEVTADGTMSKPIGTIEVRDFAGAVVSQSGAAGPMQLSPQVWQRWKAGAGHDTPDVQDIDDAALTAGRALCAQGRDLSDGDEWLQAVSALHDEPLFLHRVLATANVYGTVGKSGHKPDMDALDAVMFAIERIGLPYEWGGNGRDQGDTGFDCSGLTTAAYASTGIDLLRTAHTQYHSVPHVGTDEEPRLGDLIFFGDPDTKIHHVGLYIGNQQMVDAPTFGQAVQVHNYREPGDNYAGAGRPGA